MISTKYEKLLNHTAAWKLYCVGGGRKSIGCMVWLYSLVNSDGEIVQGHSQALTDTPTL